MEEPRYTYADCLMGRVPVPQAGHPGKFFFTLLMVGGMVTFMVTYNGLRNFNWDVAYFFANSLWLYPLAFVIAMLVRTYIGDTVVGFVLPRFIAPRFTGFAKTLVLTLLNIAVMCPIMCGIITLLLAGPDGYFGNYISALPMAFPVAYLVNLLIVGPAVKLLHSSVISSEQGLGFIIWIERNLRGITAFFGC